MTVALVDDDHVFCSGVWIDRDLILTAAHCTHDGLYSYVTYQTPAGDTEAAYVARRDEASDLALLLAAVPPSHATAALAPGNPPEGEDVDIVGHPAGFVWTLSRGCVSGYRVRDEEHVRMQLSAPVFFGNSGGGAFVRGQLVGIAHTIAFSRNMPVPNVAFFVTLSDIRSFLS
jgi:S1-C subfamily serine protease